jgi:hypothetical protein
MAVRTSTARPAAACGVDESVEQALAVMRLRRGVVGESRRVSHVVPIPDGASLPGELTALCGVRVNPRQSEVLASISGMPCEPCVSRLPIEESVSALPARG